MKRILLTLYFVFIFVLIIGMLLYGFVFTGNVVSANAVDGVFDYKYTRAICDRNVCKDFVITCNDGREVAREPITGFVTFSEDWEDYREDRENYCEK